MSKRDGRFDGQAVGRVGTLPSLGIEVPNDPDGGPWRTDARSWSTGHPGDHAAARLVGPVPRDRVTPPCCGRGGVTRSFSCRSAGGGTAPAAALATQVTDQRRLRSSGGGQSWHGRLYGAGATRSPTGGAGIWGWCHTAPVLRGRGHTHPIWDARSP